MAGKIEYFKLTPIGYWVVVLIGLSLTGVIALSPSILPYSYLGPVGSFLHYLAYEQPSLMKFVFVAAVIAHVIEAVAAFVMCQKMNLTPWDTFRWTVQTFLLGFSSLLPLRAKYKMVMTKSQ